MTVVSLDRELRKGWGLRAWAGGRRLNPAKAELRLVNMFEIFLELKLRRVVVPHFSDVLPSLQH